ncbi:MAG: DUF4367 domain-containing protein [Clostridiales bacterium]|nr:DUF4367 domain-containing protein [Clostridiales bacterium]
MEPNVQKYDDLNKLSTSELEQQLRDDERGHITLSPEEITQILTILEQRETADQSAQHPEPHEQWQQIKAAYENQKATTEEPQKTVDLSKGKKNHVAGKRHAWRPFVAAVSAAALIAVIIIPAEGFEGVFQALAEWTSNVFYFVSGDNSSEETIEGSVLQEPGEYDTIQDALSDYGVTEAVVPTWLPDGYAMTALTVDVNNPSSGDVTFYAAYERDNSLINLNYVLYKDAGSYLYEKDDSEVQIYTAGEITHYLFSNNGRFGAAWYIDNLECSVLGAESLDELKQILSSIYEES